MRRDRSLRHRIRPFRRPHFRFQKGKEHFLLPLQEPFVRRYNVVEYIAAQGGEREMYEVSALPSIGNATTEDIAPKPFQNRLRLDPVLHDQCMEVRVRACPHHNFPYRHIAAACIDFAQQLDKGPPVGGGAFIIRERLELESDFFELVVHEGKDEFFPGAKMML